MLACEYLVNIVQGRRTAQERVTGGRWRRIVLGGVLAKHVLELRGRARVWPCRLSILTYVIIDRLKKCIRLCTFVFYNIDWYIYLNDKKSTKVLMERGKTTACGVPVVIVGSRHAPCSGPGLALVLVVPGVQGVECGAHGAS